MRVATANICHGSRGKGTPVDRAGLAAIGRVLDADVVALQEVDVRTRRGGGDDQVAVVAEGAGSAAWAFGRSKRYDGGDFGNALVARWPISDAEGVRLPGPGLPFWRDRRAGLLASVAVDGRPVTVGCVHLGVKKQDSGPQLERFLARLVRRPQPWVLGGDFNRRPEHVRDLLAAAGLRLVEDGGLTFPARAPIARIDHIAVRGLEVVGAEAVTMPISDHRALVAELAWP